MAKPYIVVHMTMSINGNITGPYHSTGDAEAISKAYDRTDQTFNSNALLLGRRTIEEAFTNFHEPELNDNPKKYDRTDFRADTNLDRYVVSIDPSGKAGWQKNSIQYSTRPEMHVIQVLTEQVSDAYLEYLRDLNISYIFGGEERLDLSLVAEKLNEQFDVETLTVSGGGSINWSFFKEELIDEVSIILAPVVDDHLNRPALFDNNDENNSRVPEAFHLKNAERVEGDGLWLQYTKK
ncbi:dihydrofolate reductase family protein [Corticicoccus populi]|uniref:Dihydrofolate reductase family protein n=1 Tax=Corticicoccus populi TaxID=1812821 RepID=A0ABW5WUA5_9STAP